MRSTDTGTRSTRTIHTLRVDVRHDMARKVNAVGEPDPTRRREGPAQRKAAPNCACCDKTRLSRCRG